jgi:mono/diheme cytochrome c family protein
MTGHALRRSAGLLPSRCRRATGAALSALAAAISLTGMAHAGPTPADIEAGARLYREGVRADGSPLQAVREHGLTVRGPEAACIQCHRPSGMGGAEGNIAVPPVVGSLLTAAGQPRAPRAGRVASAIQRQSPGAETRPAYTPALLARALTTGVGASGQPMDPLMPRYRLDAQEIRQIGAYLDTLTIGSAPGYEGTTLHLATIVTTDTPPAVRNATAELLERCLGERSPPRPASSANPAAVAPAWVLHRWELGADPARWNDELLALQRMRPVFAVISGTTGSDGRGAWQPVHRHCEREQMPCVLPHTASVDDTAPSHWSFYFSRGVSLEASALAQHLIETAPKNGWRHIRQIVQRDSEAALTGAAQLRRHLAGEGLMTTELPADTPAARAAIADSGPRDALVLWLPADMLRVLTRSHPAPAATVLLSGELAGADEQAIAPDWRTVAYLTHPWDPAERHLPRLAINTGRWLARHDQPLADSAALLRLQGHSYSACEVTANALRRMGRRVGREYFLELVEGAEEAATATAYPRFTLGPGQRHGSQGTWLMRFEPAEDKGDATGKGPPSPARLKPLGEWVTPP